MKYQDPKFAVAASGTDAYRENWERIFGKKEPSPVSCVNCGYFCAYDSQVCVHCGGLLTELKPGPI